MKDTFQPALDVDEALGGVYEHPTFRNEGSVLVVDLAIAPIGLRGHLLEPASATECGPRLLNEFK